jgi:hypothetical protein
MHNARDVAAHVARDVMTRIALEPVQLATADRDRDDARRDGLPTAQRR